ncbi:MAG TPA: molybdopterin cofactor-binding domain-containing protein [Actinomycetota bacterium]|nr:molybdopterin cofactor-binding domain-containing protein [Actinomycetota bacterium]
MATDLHARYIGERVLRLEDPKLLTGQGRYLDDLTLPGMVWMTMVRSPLAHAVVKSIDSSAAMAIPGVVAVYSGADLASEWAGPLPCVWPVTEDIKMSEHFPVTKDKARYLGDAVAVVVAESRSAAEDAAALVAVDYEALPAVVDLEAAMAEGAPLVHENLGTNNSFTWVHGGTGDVAKVIAEAPVKVTERYLQPRLIPNAMEPRGVLAQLVPGTGDYVIWSATQIPHVLRILLAMILGINESRLRVIAPDVGGGFGSKLDVYAEEAICLALARKLGRPVKWVEGRSENYLSTTHGRGQIQDVELGATEDGKILGINVKLLTDMGAYFQLLTPGIPMLGAWLYTGCYSAEAFRFEYTGIFTNAPPTDAYRGAGRPEASYAIERVIDALARKVGKDPVEVRRINLMPPFEKATQSSGGLVFDSGNYQATLDRALELCGYDDLRAEQARRRQAGDVKMLGIGLSTYIELCGWAPSQVVGSLRYAGGGWDAANVRVLPTGKVTVTTGTSPHGQGHVTSWSQIVADELGVGLQDVEVLYGDTATAPLGLDTYGSRSLPVGGIAVHLAAQKVIDKARQIAAHELEVAEADLDYENGTFSVKGAPDRTRTIGALAFSAWSAHNLPPGLDPTLEATAVFDPPNLTFPSGAHVCVVEVDSETGKVEIVKYVAVDDCGNVVNPMIVDGQLHGGIAQGVAEALYEEAVYDENGILLTGSMMSYEVPSAVEIPAFTLDRLVTPSTTNPMGVKGIGEAGTIASPPAVVNAVIDALAPLGVTHVDKPCTPERVWNAIQSSAATSGGAA